MDTFFRSITEQPLVLDETVIDSHGGEVNVVILSLGSENVNCNFGACYLAWDSNFTHP
jgi:hypothetical protein